MLTRWAILSPSRIRTLSPSAQRPHDGCVASPCFRFQTVLPNTQAFPHSQGRQRKQREISEVEWEPKDECRVQKSLSWSVNRNQLRNLKQLKVTLSEVDNGTVPEVSVIEELSKRIPDLPTALKLNEGRDGGNGGVDGAERGEDAPMSTSFTHDAGLSQGRHGQRENGTESRR